MTPAQSTGWRVDTLRVLGIDGALRRCSAALIAGDSVLAELRADGEGGHAAVLPCMVDQVLQRAGRGFDLIAATVGPGGFTGLRAALALAHGLALGSGRPVVGVTLSEALAEALPAHGGCELWVAIPSRRGHVFLERAGTIAAVGLDALPIVRGPVAVAGDAAEEVAAALAGRGAEVSVAACQHPLARHVAAVGRRRFFGELPDLPAQPLYVDAPATTQPASPPRPPPELAVSAPRHAPRGGA